MRNIFLYKERIQVVFLSLFIFACGVLTNSLKESDVRAMLPIDRKVIVLDAGHGGVDPGKTGNRGLDEKDINLIITLKLQQYLEQAGAIVLVTRNTDEALAAGKKADMAQRRNIANDNDGDILVSIHQNAFPSSVAKGAQVFYHKKSENAKFLADCIQESFKLNVDSENKRLSKENDDYYILRTTKIAAVIVECGFLSNNIEEIKLNNEDYQERVAWAIYMGIIEYFSNDNRAV